MLKSFQKVASSILSKSGLCLHMLFRIADLRIADTMLARAALIQSALGASNPNLSFRHKMFFGTRPAMAILRACLAQPFLILKWSFMLNATSTNR